MYRYIDNVYLYEEYATCFRMFVIFGLHKDHSTLPLIHRTIILESAKKRRYSSVASNFDIDTQKMEKVILSLKI